MHYIVGVFLYSITILTVVIIWSIPSSKVEEIRKNM